MAAGKSVEDILAGAKAELNKANTLSSSVKSEVPAAPPAKNEYSATPYSLAAKAKKATGNDSGPGIEKELSAKKEMMDKAKKALQ
jgi:hypothetical protein